MLKLKNIAIALLTIAVMTSTIIANGAEEDSQSSESLTEENISNLIVTLESETGRAEFLANLKSLIAAEEETADDAFTLSETLNIDEKSSSLLRKYYSFIAELGLSDSSASGIIVMLIVFTLVSLLCLINNYLAKKIDRNLSSTRQKLGFSRDRFRLVFKGQRIAGYAVSAILVINAAIYLFIDGSIYSNASQKGLELSGFVLVFLLICFIVVVAWEGINAAMEYGMNDKSTLDSTRVQTLMPVVRNLVFFAIVLLSSLVLLSELGIDIVPLLAGAGVLGIAVGFGAQTMVKDFLTGFIIVFEDLIQVGDVVGVGGRTGKVETITLRKIQIRNLDGTVHTVPHSEISVVDNLTKEYSYYLMKVGVGYSEDTDKVVTCLEEIDQGLREDSEYKDKILGPIEILGVDEFADSAVIIKVRAKTRPHDKWTVGREFNRRMKKAFDEQGIEIPFPHRTLYFGNEATVNSNSENSLETKSAKEEVS